MNTLKIVKIYLVHVRTVKIDFVVIYISIVEFNERILDT